MLFSSIGSLEHLIFCLYPCKQNLKVLYRSHIDIYWLVYRYLLRNFEERSAWQITSRLENFVFLCCKHFINWHSFNLFLKIKIKCLHCVSLSICFNQGRENGRANLTTPSNTNSTTLRHELKYWAELSVSQYSHTGQVSSIVSHPVFERNLITSSEYTSKNSYFLYF